jgi:hypothetical protein
VRTQCWQRCFAEVETVVSDIGVSASTSLLESIRDGRERCKRQLARRFPASEATARAREGIWLAGRPKSETRRELWQASPRSFPPGRGSEPTTRDETCLPSGVNGMVQYRTTRLSRQSL